MATTETIPTAATSATKTIYLEDSQTKKQYFVSLTQEEVDRVMTGTK